MTYQERAAPYIGVTGIVTDDDVAIVRQLVPLAAPFRLMAGVLVSHKTLHGEPTTNRRYPPIQRVTGLLVACADAGAWPVVHFNSRENSRENLQDDLIDLQIKAREMKGLQLNVTKPNIDVVRWFFEEQRAKVEFILQVNRSSVDEPTVDAALRYIDQYEGIADHALLDFSGGTGKELDPLVVRETLRGWRSQATPGIAGGLGPKQNRLIATSLHGVPANLPVSVDAESKLRIPVCDPIPGENYQDQLSGVMACDYVAHAMLSMLPAVRFLSGSPL